MSCFEKRGAVSFEPRKATGDRRGFHALLDQQGITAKVQAAGGVKAYLFEKALADGKRDFDAGRIGPPPLWNLAVFRTAQAALGGCVEVMITGSAPLSHETQSFIQTVFNCPVRAWRGVKASSSLLLHLNNALTPC